ncbi:MAG: serine/threonine-protein kinase [Planctomycetota bacterium]|nr:serine/threonine-protein kinase [Planctomycetota bacterium]
MNEHAREGRRATPAPDPRIAGGMARRLVELGLMQENVYHPQGNIPTPEELSELLGEFEVEGLIGRGGMGAVYRARQKSLDRTVAIKVLTAPPDSDGGFAERFQREAQALASLTHPGIVSVYDFGRAGGVWYLVMELVEGTDLRRVIDTRAVTPREALSIVSQVCAALQYAHDQGVVHRDIKPGNVLLDRDGQVRITDFGLAKLAGVRPSPTLTRATQVMGTPHYMAPEQVESPLEVDHRADLYSVGVVLYELLTGELPIGNFSLPSQRVQVDVRLDDVVLRALEKDPPKRYQTATEVRTDVDEVVARPGTVRAVAPPARRSHAALIGWSVAACFALATLFLAPAVLFGVRAAPAPALVEMRDLLVEEDGRIVSKTIEFDERGVPRVSAHFASVFGMDADAVAQADAYLGVQRKAYLALESAGSSPYWDDRGGRVLVTVDDFHRNRDDLARHTMSLLEGTLGAGTIPPTAIEEIERALFPLGRGDSLLAFGEDAEAGLTLEVTCATGDRGVFELSGERALREFGHHLDGLAQPAVSVLPSVRALLTALEGVDWGGARWQVSQLSAQAPSESVESVHPQLDAGGRGEWRRSLPTALPRAHGLLAEVVVSPAESDGPALTEAVLSELQARITNHLRDQALFVASETMVSARPTRGLPENETSWSVQIHTDVVISHPPAPFAPAGSDLAGLATASVLRDALQHGGMTGLAHVRSSSSTVPGAFSQLETSLTYSDTETVADPDLVLAVFEAVERGGQVGALARLGLQLDVTGLRGRSTRRDATDCSANFLLRAR